MSYKLKTFKEWLQEKDPQLLSEMDRRGFLGTIGAMAATGLASKAFAATPSASSSDWQQKGYREITNSKDWIKKPSFGYDVHGQMVTHDDLVHNIHNKLKNDDIDNADSRLGNKKRDELIPGKDFRIFEVIPKTFMRYLVPNPEKFIQDYQQFSQDSAKQTGDMSRKFPSSQDTQRFEQSKIIVFLPTRLGSSHTKGQEGKQVEYGGVATIFKPYVYDKETDSYKVNKKFEFKTLLGEASIIVPYAGDITKVNLEELPPFSKRVLAHELRHTTQQSGTGGLHVLGKDRSSVAYGKSAYTGNAAELGVRIAALKDLIDAGNCKRIFDSSVRQTTYADPKNLPQKMLWTQEIQKRFNMWLSSSEKMRAYDLILVQPCGHKLGYQVKVETNQTPTPKLPNAQPQPSLNEKQEFQNNLISKFIFNFINQDPQISHLVNLTRDPNASGEVNSMGIDEGFIKDLLDELDYGEYPQATKYAKDLMQYIMDNWDFVVHKSFHKELGIA